MLVNQMAKYALRRITKSNRFFTEYSSSESKEIQWASSEGSPSVSIIVPTRDKVELLRNCINSIRGTTKYPNYEIVVVDNDSKDPSTSKYLRLLMNEGVKVIAFPGKFNFAKICNYAAASVSGEYLCFLNNDAEVLSPLWLDDLVTSSLDKNVCVSGPVILADQDTVQEIGLGFGIAGIAGQIYSGVNVSSAVVKGALQTDHFVSAISFACALVSQENYWNLNGLDEDFAVGLNDVDFCFRALERGFVNKVVSSSLIIHKGFGSRPTMKTVKGAWLAFKEVALFLRKNPTFNFEDKYLNAN